ncbi:sugar ABC transporter permease [Agromyces sp. Root81]|uniref:ABC transporter permease n=1 Tax=Agromyces sp. Root81 TaxID=1736601 RepID=UPI0006FEAA1E|nr:ABC transporter permease [Agromyces sp. Root81]KRC62581.1 sugar ABC transporter permease [Agromyces sp. Root81]
MTASKETRVSATTQPPALRAPESPPRPKSPARSLFARIGVQNLSLVIALILLIAVIGWQDPNFFRYQNLLSIGTSITVFGILAIVQTLVILLGALDISVGSVAGLTSVVSAMVFTSTASSWMGIGAALAAGLACGLVNGLIIVYGRVNAVIATLATLAAFKGLAQILSGGRSQGYTGNDPVFTALGRGTFLGIPVLIYLFVFIAVAAALVLKYTDIGRNIYAIGGNPTAARLSGINLNRYIVGVYVLVGTVAGLAGVLLTARTGSGQPVSGSEGLELESITAAALGGAALTGGKGTITGTVLAVILLGVLSNGLTVLGVNPFWQNVAKGALLVIAVVIQQRRSGQRAVGLPA